jgi:hypothetical protein
MTKKLNELSITEVKALLDTISNNMGPIEAEKYIALRRELRNILINQLNSLNK